MIINLIKHPLTFTFIVFSVVATYQDIAYSAPTPALVGADANELLLVEPTWLLKQIDSKDIVIMDVRPSADYQKNHIKNAKV